MEYNGWTNYATWRVKLENFDDTTYMSELWDNYGRPDAYDFGNNLKKYLEEIITEQSDSKGIAQDYALAFIHNVNWEEIAESLIIDFGYEEGYGLQSYMV